MELPSKEMDLESNPVQYEYDPWLLDDHPLRSHPTVCIPGLGALISESFVAARKQWKQCLIRGVGLVVACFIAFQCFQYIPLRVAKSLTRPAPSRINHREWEVRCTFPRSDPRPSALTQSVAAGCEGFRIDIWLHGDNLQMGHIDSSPQEGNDLQLRLESLFTSLKPRDLQTILSSEATDSTDSSESTESTDPSFSLVLDAQTSISELYPILLAQLEPLRQKEYLTIWDGSRVVPGRVTVVLTGDNTPEFNCAEKSSDVFWSSRDDVSRDAFMNDHLIPMCAE